MTPRLCTYALSVTLQPYQVEHSRRRCGATFTKVFDADGGEAGVPGPLLTRALAGGHVVLPHVTPCELSA